MELLRCVMLCGLGKQTNATKNEQNDKRQTGLREGKGNAEVKKKGETHKNGETGSVNVS